MDLRNSAAYTNYRLNRYEHVRYANTPAGFKVKEVVTLNLMDPDPRNLLLFRDVL